MATLGAPIGRLAFPGTCSVVGDAQDGRDRSPNRKSGLTQSQEPRKICGLFFYFSCLGPDDLFRHFRIDRSILVGKLGKMGCELVQADLAYGLSRFGSPNPRLSSRLSFIGWDSFKALFCVVSGNSYGSELGCFLHNRNFDFRLVLATIRHLAIFAIWFYLVRSRLLFCFYFVLGHRFHAPVVGAALARL